LTPATSGPDGGGSANETNGKDAAHKQSIKLRIRIVMKYLGQAVGLGVEISRELSVAA
jgi:hypothetical protein